jgi:hypothetical protein
MRRHAGRPHAEFLDRARVGWYTNTAGIAVGGRMTEQVETPVLLVDSGAGSWYTSFLRRTVLDMNHFQKPSGGVEINRLSK